MPLCEQREQNICQRWVQRCHPTQLERLRLSLDDETVPTNALLPTAVRCVAERARPHVVSG
eukprot:m.1638237 g.1638237  ORF g.1638237 m.1638237 type:complete len:61 (-) comp27306_c0_seq1:413-595(-)